MPLTAKLLLAFGAIVLITVAAAGAVLCESSLQPHHRRVEPVPAMSAAENVRIRSYDGTTLAGWFLKADRPSRGSVLLFHGHTDSRRGVAGYAAFLQRDGYDVLSVDARAHGESGGAMATFGVLEARDAAAWTNWLATTRPAHCIFAYGGSYGASVLIQALPNSPLICAAVAESPFTTLANIGAYRIRQQIGDVPALPELITWNAIAYARLRYHLDLNNASPLAAVSRSSTPLLLIHGTADTNIPLSHSEAIQRARRTNVELWKVPGAAHLGAWSTAGNEFERRVVEWFVTHDVAR